MLPKIVRGNENIADGTVTETNLTTALQDKINAAPTEVNVTDDLTTNAYTYPVWVEGYGADEALKTTSTKLTWNPANGVMYVNYVQSNVVDIQPSGITANTGISSSDSYNLEFYTSSTLAGYINEDQNVSFEAGTLSVGLNISTLGRIVTKAANDDYAFAVARPNNALAVMFGIRSNTGSFITTLDATNSVLYIESGFGGGTGGAIKLRTGNYGALVDSVNVDDSGVDILNDLTISGTLFISNGAVVSGVYTPTLTNVTNLDASTAYSCQYMRVGNVVTVSGRVDIDPTTTLTDTQLGISLPIASNLANANEAGGSAYATAIAAQGAAILGDATNNRFTMQWKAIDVTNQPMYFTATYRII